MATVCRVGASIITVYRNNERWQATVLHPERKWWSQQFTSHHLALIDGIKMAFVLQRTNE